MGLKLALIQMNIAFGQPNINYRTVEKRVTEAVKEKVDVIVLPELWTTGYDLSRLAEIADPGAKKAIHFLSTLAKTHHTNIVAGSVAKQTEKGTTNTMLMFNRDGRLVKEYSKAHLFRLMNEEKYLVQGEEDGLFELEGEPCAGVICYDIRFPDWIRTHMVGTGLQPKVLYVVAEWPKKRIDHWRALLISRAIENQCYVIACNRVGSDPNNEFGGHSMVIGPWGEVISEAQEEETILYKEIDLKAVDIVREEIPVFEDRRPALYRV
ncbi:carbon-nitrogen hydrolase [Salipaludibacillus neizhouensis]|uniref:Carbon-nitrogen hydrolase n=1 Tax=Salipaludibacillus neizhouensis TaxID=885475 RepID=A0A3A9KF99_9BACI|nr:carbon-nitrogen family hydrolase [Salipaludibacillus neizhouensis]RKL68293.1 carbon-nitrogen hydrolase [Salipaludibacillus neizhouensis]